MPKISKRTIAVYQDNDGTHVSARFDIEINYSKGVFWAEIPPGFEEGFDLLSEEEIKTFGTQHNAHTYGRPIGQGKRIVTADSEGEAESRMKSLVNHLVALKTEKVPVIILDYDGTHSRDRSGRSYFRSYTGDITEAGGPGIGLKLSFEYATKIIAGGLETKYYQYSDREFNGRIEQFRKEVRLNNGSRVIPDTPENREIIEGIYRALQALDKKLTDLTETPEKILEFIASKQILIPEIVG